MGYAAYMEFGGNAEHPTYVGDVGTAAGWGDLCRWIDTLESAIDFKELHLLRSQGWSQELPTLEGQLLRAIRRHPPGHPSVLKGARNLLAMLGKRKDAEVITISDGTK